MGKPINALKYLLDCEHYKIDEDTMPSIYLRLLWCLIIPLFYIITVAIFYLVFVKIKLISHH